MGLATVATPVIVEAQVSPEGGAWGGSVDLGLDYLALKRDVTFPYEDGFKNVHFTNNGSLFVGVGILYSQYLGLKLSGGVGGNFDNNFIHNELIWGGIEINGYIPLHRYVRLQGGLGFTHIDLSSDGSPASDNGAHVSGVIMIGNLMKLDNGMIAGPFLSISYSQYFVSDYLWHRIALSFSALGWWPS